MKKPEFLLPFAKLFTRGCDHAYEGIAFRETEIFGDETFPALTSPTNWSVEAVAMLASAACTSIPGQLRAIEQNTVPSWLWQHRGRTAVRARESDVRALFNRAVGAATAKAWALNYFSGEKHARAFYDEVRYALVHRHIAITPDVIAPWGLSWAYGLEARGTQASSTDRRASARSTRVHELSNGAIDAAIEKGPNAALWRDLFARYGEKIDESASWVTLRLRDTAQDWHSSTSNAARASIDVLALRHNDGSINIEALRQAARSLTILLDLHDRSDVTLGLANMATLLVALGLAYDSDAARALCASLAALVTAECTRASAEMAALRGPSEAFVADRDAAMRSLRNHRRAVYGDTNDYEKLAVLPAPLPLKNCPDLSLVAEAQRGWDEAVAHAHAFGLRSMATTDLTPSPVLALLMTSSSQGIEPLASLKQSRHSDDEHFVSSLHPAVHEALVRLDYPATIARGIEHHVMGVGSLLKAPAIGHARLRQAGMSDAALEKIEAYLPCVDTIRLAITPWIVGTEFCHDILHIPLQLLHAPGFDLLAHLGFNEPEIAQANAFCYGHGTVRTTKLLHLRHRSVFATGLEVSTDARLRMAAAVQSFISGDTGVTATLPATDPKKYGAETVLSAWKSGLKSVTMIFDPHIRPLASREARVGNGRRLAAQPQSKTAPFTKTTSRLKSGRSTTALTTKKARPSYKGH